MKHLLALCLSWVLLSSPAFAETPARIISLAPNVTEVLYDLGLGERVVAVSSYCDYPPVVKGKPKIGGMSNPSLEAIVAIKPDMVILTDDGNPREIERRLRKLEIRTYVFRARRLDDLPREIRTLGIALDIRDRADRRAGRIERIIRQYADKAKPSSGRVPKKVLFIIQPDPLIVAGPGTVIDDVFKLLGLHNIAANAHSEYPRYSLEEVIRQSPDVLFIGKMHDDINTISSQLLKRLNDLEAVRKGNIYYIGDPMFRMGPRITEGIAEIARCVEKGQKEQPR